jgi:putative oxidoreductase
VAQSWVDIFGHGVSAEDRGSWFDAASDGLILDQRAFWVFLLLYLVVRGGGPLSVDALLRSRLQPQTSLA